MMNSSLDLTTSVLAIADTAKKASEIKSPIDPTITAVIALITSLFTLWKLISDVAKNRSDAKKNKSEMDKALFQIQRDQSEIYKNLLDQYDKSGRTNVESITRAADLERKSLEVILRQKDADITGLKERITKTEGFYSRNEPSKIKGSSRDPMLENIRLFLQYIEGKMGDEQQEGTSIN
jgi:hypothetical protein